MISILAIIFVSTIYSKKEVKEKIKNKEKIISVETIPIVKYKNEYDSIYKTTKFKPDTIGGSLGTNLKSGEYLKLAENLLQQCYEKHVKELEREIPLWQTLPEVQVNYKNMLIELKNSQIKWEKYKESVVAYTHHSCEGGTGCVAIYNSKNIELIFQRIEELEN